MNIGRMIRLGRIGDESAVAPLIKALKHPETAMRLRAAAALGELQNREAVMPLANLLLSDDDPDLYFRPDTPLLC